MADSPTLNANGPIGVTIKASGAPIPDALSVIRVHTRKEVGRIPEATVVIADGSVAMSEFPATDGDTFALGAEIEICAYYGDETERSIFKGVIFSKRLRIVGEDGSQLHLVVRDKAQKMTIVRSDNFYAATKDSDIMSSLVGDAGLTAEITATLPEPRDQIRRNCTSWDFLRALADRNGMLVFVDDAKVTVKKPDTSTAAVLTLTLGVDIFSFDASASSGHMIDAASGTAWDDSAQSTVKSDSAAATALTWGVLGAAALAEPAGSATLDATTPANIASDVLKNAADARVERAVLSAMQGRASFTGSGLVNPGDMIELTGVGAAFGGNAFISGVEHRIEAGTWITETMLGLPDDWRADSRSLTGAGAGASTPSMTGLHIGKVMQITSDPDDRLRIQVSLSPHGLDDSLVWARYATPYSTVDAGVFFMPEIDDEVVIGFLDGHPDNAIVVGSLHNGTTAQPYEPDEGNTIKAIVTKNKLKIEFNDDSLITTVSTPGGHSVVLDDAATEVTVTDSTGNTLTMSSSGIDMTSPGNINITADGNIALSAGGDATVEGNNIELTAQMQLTGSGSAGAELSSSGQTVVKGSIVMIN